MYEGGYGYRIKGSRLRVQDFRVSGFQDLGI